MCDILFDVQHLPCINVRYFHVFNNLINIYIICYFYILLFTGKFSFSICYYMIVLHRCTFYFYTSVCLRIYPKKNVEGYLFFFINVIIVKIYLFSFKYIDIIIYVICSVFLATIRCLSYVSIY